MNCPVCGKEMIEGGIITSGIAMWHPQGEFSKKGWNALYYKGGKMLGKHNILLRETKIPSAYYCSNCNTVAGVFAVAETD